MLEIHVLQTSTSSIGRISSRFIGQYRNEYFKPDKQNGYLVYSYKPLPDAEQQIYEKISDITVSMKAIDHLHMPELLSNEYPVQLSDMEQETYKQFKSEFWRCRTLRSLLPTLQVYPTNFPNWRMERCMMTPER